MKKFLVISLMCLLVLCGCGKVKLANGEEAVLTFEKDDEKYEVSAEELFEDLKTNFGLTSTVEIIDKYIFEKEFSDYAKTAMTQAESTISSIMSNYESEDQFLLALRDATIYQTKEAYTNAIYLSSLRSHAVEEYAKLQVTDEDREKYYNEEAKGDVELYHILVTADVTDSMTTKEKEEAEQKAKDKIDEIIKALDAADDKLAKFKELVKEYSEDESTKDKDGLLGTITYYDLDSTYDELLDSAYKLKDGEYSKSAITTELGYHVIYRNSSKELEPLEDLKDEITEILSERELKENAKISVEALKYYRDLYNTKILDSELDRQYGIDYNNQLNATTQTTTN